MAHNPALGCSMQFSCWDAGRTKATFVLTKEAVRGGENRNACALLDPASELV
jgi:hypothetical protein